MRDLGLLLKNYLKVYIGGFTSKSKRSYFSGAIMILLFGLLFIFLFASTAYTTIEEIVKLGLDPSISLYAMTAIGLLFMLLIMLLKGTNTRKFNDANILIPLPINKYIVVFSKILRDFLFDFVSLLAVMMPGYVVYSIKSGAPRAYLVIIFGFILVLLLSLLSNAVSLFLSSILQALTRKFKHGNVIQTIINVFLTIIFLIFYYYFMTKIQQADADSINILMSIKPLAALVSILVGPNIGNLLIVIAICVIPFIISVIYSTLTFNRNYKGYVNTNKELVFVENNVVKDLCHREINRYFNSTSYVLNTIIGGLFLILFSFLVLIIGKDRIIEMITLYMPDGVLKYLTNIDVLIIIIMGLITSTIITTSASISLEGKNLWILKANPINEKDIFYSKLLLNIIIGIIPILISSIIICVRIGFIYLPFIIVLLVLFLIWTSLNGLLINLKYPKLEFRDEQEVIKQSMSIFISFITSIIPGIILIGVFFVFLFNLNAFISLGIMIGIILLIDVIAYEILMKKGIRQFKEMYN